MGSSFFELLSEESGGLNLEMGSNLGCNGLMPVRPGLAVPDLCRTTAACTTHTDRTDHIGCIRRIGDGFVQVVCLPVCLAKPNGYQGRRH